MSDCTACGGSGYRADELGLAEDDPGREMLDTTRCHTCHGTGADVLLTADVLLMFAECSHPPNPIAPPNS